MLPFNRHLRAGYVNMYGHSGDSPDVLDQVPDFTKFASQVSNANIYCTLGYILLTLPQNIQKSAAGKYPSPPECPSLLIYYALRIFPYILYEI